MCSFKSIYFIIFVLNLYKTNAEISDKRLCVNLECNEPVSLARTLLRYSSIDARILSFTPNVEVKIFSKEAGAQTDLWGAEINGKRGYVPKRLVKEYKILNTPTVLVDTELNQQSQVPPKNTIKEVVEPDKVQEPFEIVDGTTIYSGSQDGINPSSTESPALSTTVPVATSREVKDEVEEDAKIKEETSEKNPEEKSVVKNAWSKLSLDWITGDADSEELDDEYDNYDENEEEEEEEEEESFENDNMHIKESSINEQEPNIEIQKDLEISTYSLELDESFKDMVNQGSVLKESKSVKDEVATNIPLVQNVQQTQAVPENKGNLPSENEPKPDVVPQVLISKTEIPSANKVDMSPVASEAYIQAAAEKSANPEVNQAEIKVEDSKPNPNIETVTEPTLSEDEPLPIFSDDTPTPTTETSVKEPSLPEPIYEQKLPVILSSATPMSPHLNVETQALPAAKAEEPSANVAEVKESQTAYDQKEADFELKFDTVKNQIPETKDSQQALEPPASPQTENIAVVNESPKESDLDMELHTTVENQALEPEAVKQTAYITGNQNFGKEEQKPASAYSPPPHLGGIFNKAENLISNEESSISRSPDEDDLKREEHISDNVSTEGSQEDTLGGITQEETPTNEENASNTIDEITKAPEEEIYSYTDITLKGEDEDSNEDVMNVEKPREEQITTDEENRGFLSGLLSLFDSSSSDASVPSLSEQSRDKIEEHVWSQTHEEKSSLAHCEGNTENCNTSHEDLVTDKGLLEQFGWNFNSDMFILLITTAVSVILLLFGYLALDRNGREAPLIAKINKLEKELLITLEENKLLQEKSSADDEEFEKVPHEAIAELTQRIAEAQLSRQALEEKLAQLVREVEDKATLEEQVESLEKELETSTEVGMELNRIISEMLDPMNGSDKLKENVEQLQRQLLEQRDTINSVNETRRDKEQENQVLRVELERSKKKAVELQHKVDEMLEKVLKIEKEKDQQQSSLQNEIAVCRQKYNEVIGKEDLLNNDVQVLRVKLSEAQRQVDLKSNEYQQLKESLGKIKSVKNDKEVLKSLLDSTSMKAELQQLQSENATYIEQLQAEQGVKLALEKRYQAMVEEVNVLKAQYEQADKEKVEVNSKLEVLNNYFKKRETELQEEVIKYKSIWDAKEGEATSTTERIKYMQEEIENYKEHNKTLKEEIISQEIELKSKISMLEKKVHENWVIARQTERKLEDARQEAAQLRNRLTLRERSINEERIQNRLQSPVEQNGELPLSPLPIDSTASPPLIYGGRDHITKSPPIHGLPPFLPPLPGAPFMPPPIHGMPPFMPPPPSMFPGDHRPPPLGRMSSPPLNSRYSPDALAFSPYDRNSPSPPYDSEYGASPPPIRGYSPYNSRDDRRDYKRPPHTRTNGRNMKGPVMSSGSDHSNDSLDKVNRRQSKMV